MTRGRLTDRDAGCWSRWRAAKRRPRSKDRWSGTERDYGPLRPVIVAEVSTDLLSADFMRHGARLLRIQQDKNPEDCLIDQIR